MCVDGSEVRYRTNSSASTPRTIRLSEWLALRLDRLNQQLSPSDPDRVNDPSDDRLRKPASFSASRMMPQTGVSSPHRRAASAGLSFVPGISRNAPFRRVTATVIPGDSMMLNREQGVYLHSSRSKVGNLLWNQFSSVGFLCGFRRAG